MPGYGAVAEDDVRGIEAGSNKIGATDNRQLNNPHLFILRELQHEWVGVAFTSLGRVRSPGAPHLARQSKGNGIPNYPEANVQARNKDNDSIGTFAEPLWHGLWMQESE